MAVGVPNDRRRSTEMKKDLQQICADFNSVTLTSGGFRILLRGVRDFAREALAIFFAPPRAIFAPP